MLDVFGIPSSFTGNVQIFNLPTTVTNVQWHSWLKPRGTSMFYLMCIGGGGGGGGGFTRIAGNAGGGGGSGGNSGITRVTGPVFLLPDKLYIQVGAGGQGVGSGGGTAGSGIISLVSIGMPTVTPSTQPAPNVLALSSPAGSGAAGGGTGTGAAVGALGAGGVIPAVTGMPYGANNFTFDFIAGVPGVQGGAVAGANGNAQTISNSTPFWGATSGAGTTAADFAGGAFTATADSILSEMRPATPAAGSNPGSSGLTIWQPFFSFGGGGGSSSNAGVGGAGGNGGYGCGGGGGGAGTTGGRGGDGGSGLVIIICW